MKPSITKYAALLIFLMVLASPLSYVCAELQFQPHDNPGAAPANVDPVSLMNYYSSLFQFISKSDYPGFKELIASYYLTSLPASLQGLFNSFTAELNSANSNMQQIDQLLANSSSLLDQNRRSDANQTLYEASIIIGGTEIILNQLGNTTLSIGDQLNVTTTPSNSPSRQALGVLQNSIQAVQNQLDNYLMELQALRTRAISDNVTTTPINITDIEVKTPYVGYPGLSFPIQGNVTSDNGTPLEGRIISIYIDNTKIIDLSSSSQGDFYSNYTIPANSTTGSHWLNIYVAPQGTFAGTSWYETFSIERYPLNLTLSYPGTVYLPTSFTVEGNISSALGRLSNATVTISVGNTIKIVKTVDGSFGATFDLPFSLLPVGNQLLSITVEPVEPWHAGLEVSDTMNVLSPIPLIAVSSALLLIVTFSILWIRRNRMSKKSSSPVGLSSEGPVIVKAPSEPPTPPEIPPFDGSELALPPVKSIQNIQIGSLTSERQKVIQSYARAWHLIERTTGVLMEPYTTINEFLRIASARLDGTKDSFSCLTALAERSLYSQFDPAPEDISLAEGCARSIEEAFKYGSA